MKSGARKSTWSKEVQSVIQALGLGTATGVNPNREEKQVVNKTQEEIVL